MHGRRHQPGCYIKWESHRVMAHMKPQPSATAPLITKPNLSFHEDSQIQGNIPKQRCPWLSFVLPLSSFTPATTWVFCILVFWHPEAG